MAIAAAPFRLLFENLFSDTHTFRTHTYPMAAAPKPSGMLPRAAAQRRQGRRDGSARAAANGGGGSMAVCSNGG